MIEQWWGYEKTDGQIVCYKVMYDYNLSVTAAINSKHVKQIFYPFPAVDRDAAINQIKEMMK